MGAIDRRHLDEQCAGDAALAAELLDLFAGQCRRILPALADAGLDTHARADHAHTLKGSAAGVGAERIRGLCARIEDALRQGVAPADDLRALEAAAAEALDEIARGVSAQG